MHHAQQLADKRQAEAGSLIDTIEARVGLPEGFQRVLQIVLAHAYAGVDNAQDSAALGGGLQAKLDGASGMSELDRVDEQIDEYLLQAAFVRLYDRDDRGRMKGEPHLSALGARANDGEAVLADAHEVDRLDVEALRI